MRDVTPTGRDGTARQKIAFNSPYDGPKNQQALQSLMQSQLQDQALAAATHGNENPDKQSEIEKIDLGATDSINLDGSPEQKGGNQKTKKNSSDLLAISTSDQEQSRGSSKKL